MHAHDASGRRVSLLNDDPQGQTPFSRVDSPTAGVRPPSTLNNGCVGLNPSAATSPSGGSGKRYPCRHRDSHGCEKTFTTSSHASRHSKVHTAKKAVPCTHPGCTKNFTRTDNMKQHLQTHYRDKSSPFAALLFATALPLSCSRPAIGRCSDNNGDDDDGGALRGRYSSAFAERGA